MTEVSLVTRMDIAQQEQKVANYLEWYLEENLILDSMKALFNQIGDEE